MNEAGALAAGSITRVVSFWRQWAASPGVRDAVSLIEVDGERFICGPERLRPRLATTNFTIDALVDALGTDLAEVVGEARLAYGDEQSLRLAATPDVETIHDDDRRLATLRATADPHEWDESGMDEPGDRRFIVLENGIVVAASNLRNWGTTIGHIGVFTAGDTRRRGLAGGVGGAAARHCVDSGRVAQWRSRIGNVASARVADRLGFIAVGRQIHARVRPVD